VSLALAAPATGTGTPTAIGASGALTAVVDGTDTHPARRRIGKASQ
jgi:hypothetical protein